MAQRALLGLAVLLLSAVIAATFIGWKSWTFIAVEISVLAVMLLGDRWLTPRLERQVQGNDGEIKDAEILASAEVDGWRALHDVQSGRGNTDHILVGPGGILTVETKSHRGRFKVDSLNEHWLKQAYAQRKRVERITGRKADALLVFSDAYLIGKPVSRQRGVCVLPARMLRGHLAGRPHQLSPDEVDSIYRRLAVAFAS